MTIESVSDIKNIPVVSIKEGSIMGLVSKIYLDPELQRVAGVAYKKTVMGHHQFVPLSNIRLYGSDTILVDTDSVFMLDSEVPDRVRRQFKDLRGITVSTTKGENIGVVADLEIHGSDGAITRLHLSDGRSIDLGKMTVAIGSDHVVIEDDQLELIDTPKEKPPGVFSRLFHPET